MRVWQYSLSPSPGKRLTNPNVGKKSIPVQVILLSTLFTFVVRNKLTEVANLDYWMPISGPELPNQITHYLPWVVLNQGVQLVVKRRKTSPKDSQ